MKRALVIAAISLLMAAAPALPITVPSLEGKISKPEVAAQRLYGAYKRHNRRAALQVASTSAVKELFSSRWTGPDWEFYGCEKSGAGYYCVYRYEAGGVRMRVIGGAKAGYRVQSVEFRPS